MSDDRTVHGIAMNGQEIVRYDRAGHWYFEGQGYRARASVFHAARVAALATFYPGLPGGRVFDRKVREFRALLASGPVSDGDE